MNPADINQSGAKTMNTRERLENRLRKRAEWAESRRDKAAQSFARAEKLSERFAGGQPILVGHHSEGRARRDQQRIENGMRDGVENMRAADRHEERAGPAQRRCPGAGSRRGVRCPRGRRAGSRPAGSGLAHPCGMTRCTP